MPPTFRLYTLDELAAATDDWIDRNRIHAGVTEVFRGTLDGALVAIKRVPIGLLQNFFVEVSTLQRLQHPNLMNLIGIALESEQESGLQRGYLVFPFIAGGDLQGMLDNDRISRTLDWRARLLIIRDAADCLTYLHAHGPTLHRDFKPGNCFLDGGLIVSDLGISRELRSGETTHMTQAIGTPGFLDEDAVRYGSVSTASDVYAFGVSLLILLTGRPALSYRRAQPRLLADDALDAWLESGSGSGSGSTTVRSGVTGMCDARIWNRAPRDVVERLCSIAVDCIQRAREDRPSMPQVLASIRELVATSVTEDPPPSCLVCGDNPREVVLLPCGHNAACEMCALRRIEAENEVCPVCEARFTEYTVVRAAPEPERAPEPGPEPEPEPEPDNEDTDTDTAIDIESGSGSMPMPMPMPGSARPFVRHVGVLFPEGAQRLRDESESESGSGSGSGSAFGVVVEAAREPAPGFDDGNDVDDLEDLHPQPVIAQVHPGEAEEMANANANANAPVGDGAAPAPAPAPARRLHPPELSTESVGDHTCVVCLERPRAALLPCDHGVLCELCALEFVRRGEHCPLCRLPFIEFRLVHAPKTFDPGRVVEPGVGAGAGAGAGAGDFVPVNPWEMAEELMLGVGTGAGADDPNHHYPETPAERAALAVRLYEAAAARGHARAYIALAECHESGIGTGRINLEMRNEMLRRARAAGDPLATAWCTFYDIEPAATDTGGDRGGHPPMRARTYSQIQAPRPSGSGVGSAHHDERREREKAAERRECYRVARMVAEADIDGDGGGSGDVRAIRLVALCLEKGHGTATSRAEAIAWYRRAAERGHPTSQFHLASVYEHVSGRHGDAVDLHRRSASMGHAIAQKCIGHCYFHGRGIGKDERVAVEWYTRSAMSGHAVAQHLLDQCYRNGRGVEANVNEAVVWFRRAAGQGLEMARGALRELEAPPPAVLNNDY